MSTKKRPLRRLTIDEEIERDLWEGLMAREEALSEETCAETIEDELDLMDAIEGVRERQRFGSQFGWT